MAISEPASLPGNSQSNRRIRGILTPEGVELQVELADAGERAAAFLIDIAIMSAVIAVISIGGLILLSQIDGMLAGRHLAGWVIAAGIILIFAIRTFYFSWFELRWSGRTPGKKMLGLRVIDRTGGPLLGQAVVARNLTREIEFFLPSALLLAGPALATSQQWLHILLLIWLGIFVLMPLFNRDRLRVGDLIAGTWVIVAPKARLLPDLTAEDNRRWRRSTTGSVAHRGFDFTPQQLDIYGAYELQALEALLRRQDPAAGSTRHEVAQRIIRRINWPDPLKIEDVDAFLDSFYAAQRRRLEGQMLFGIRRKDKHDRGSGRS
jgi:uncharacterized RDD family membrane protein YckC